MNTKDGLRSALWGQPSPDKPRVTVILSLGPQNDSINATNRSASQGLEGAKSNFSLLKLGSTYGVVTSDQDRDKEYNVSLCGDQITSVKAIDTLCQVLDWASCWAQGMMKASGLHPKQPPLIHNRHLSPQTRQLAPGPLDAEWFFEKSSHDKLIYLAPLSSRKGEGVSVVTWPLVPFVLFTPHDQSTIGQLEWRSAGSACCTFIGASTPQPKLLGTKTKILFFQG